MIKDAFKVFIWAASLFFAGWVGYFFGELQGIETKTTEQSPSKQAAQAAAEAFEPTCEQLSKGLSQVTTIHTGGADHLLIIPEDDYFFVVNIRVEPDGQPVVGWWGAGLEHAKNQACGESQ